jgi:hypothetical protein
MNPGMRSSTILALLALVSVPCLAPACQRDRKPEPAPAHASAAPVPAWTSAFLREAVLVADEIVVEGPQDLIDHVVLRPDPETNVYAAKTVSAGLLQELSARPETRMEVRGQLDAWSLAAFRRITVLRRPGEVPVTVRASGNAYWAAADGSGERRQDQLVFQGLRGR